jgi:tRNA pseudouridine13 synthase
MSYRDEDVEDLGLPGERLAVPIPPELERGYATKDVPPISGEARLVPEDFLVEEVPLYEACGEGEHLYVQIEKRGLGTPEAVRRLARHLGVRDRDVGCAGLKDARAITRQTLSFQLVPEDALAGFADPKIRVLSSKRHKNKLKLGHLKGNRFTIRLRGVSADDEARARATLEGLARTGAPNYFGMQRFGIRRNTHKLGAALVREDAAGFLEELFKGVDRAAIPPSYQAERSAQQALASAPGDPVRAVRAIALKWRRFYASGLQSVLFNRYLTRRLDRIGKLEAGEIAYLNRNGAAFVVEDEATDQARCLALELSPSGPMFGHKLLRPREGSSPRADEDAVLAEMGLSNPELSDALGASPRGERRALRVLVSDATVARDGEDLVLGFFLPKGCYATSVLEELLKRPID